MQRRRHSQMLGRVIRAPGPPMFGPLSLKESITQIIIGLGWRARGRNAPGGPRSTYCSSSSGMRFTNILSTVISMSPSRIFPPLARRSLRESGPKPSGICAVGGATTSTHVPVPAGLHHSFRPSWRSMRPAALSSPMAEGPRP
jgi:hypothetical protein